MTLMEHFSVNIIQYATVNHCVRYCVAALAGNFHFKQTNIISLQFAWEKIDQAYFYFGVLEYTQ